MNFQEPSKLKTKDLKDPTLSLGVSIVFSTKVRPLWLKQAKNFGFLEDGL
jgi:hypothetical protein